MTTVGSGMCQPEVSWGPRGLTHAQRVQLLLYFLVEIKCTFGSLFVACVHVRTSSGPLSSLSIPRVTLLSALCGIQIFEQ